VLLLPLRLLLSILPLRLRDLEPTAAELLTDERVRRAYLG